MTIEGLGTSVPAERLGAEPAGPSEEVLHHPLALRGLAAGVSYDHHRGEGDYYLTPAVHIEDDDLGVHAEVRIGHLRPDTSETIFVVDQDGMKPWYTMGSKNVARGDGEIVEDMDELKLVRGVLLRAGAALNESAVQAINEFDVAAIPFDEKISAEIAQLEARLAHLRALQSESDKLPIKLAITLNSGWSREGEESPTTEYDGATPLTEAMQAAVDNFKRVNRRSDVQASAEVRYSRGETTYAVPREVWESYFRVIAGPIGFYEAQGLRYAADELKKQAAQTQSA